jgi:hypothetical protein
VPTLTLVLRGRVVTRQAPARPATGYAVEAAIVVEQSVLVGEEWQTLRAPAGGSARADAEGDWAIRIKADGDPVGPAQLSATAPDGTRVATETVAPGDFEKPITLRVPAPKLPTFAPAEEPTTGERPLLTGRVVDSRGRETPARLPVGVWAKTTASADARPVAVTETQPGGFFSALWPQSTYASAEGRVDRLDAVTVRLEEDGHLPRDIVLVVDLGELGEDAECACKEPPPRAPDQADLVQNPAAFSQDLGAGCVDLTVPNRTVEEFSYRFVIRTSEPRVKALTLGVRHTVPHELLSDLLGVVMASEVFTPRTRAHAGSAQTALRIDVRSARHLVRADRPPTLAAVGRASWLSEVEDVKRVIDAGLHQASGRNPLDADHAIDWDDTPTIHQTIELAHGHVLHMREVWRADGYSLGDLLYSLPLAPLQRRQIAVVDWERRTVSERTEALEFEEELEAFLGRDRDVREIVGTHLREETAGGSESTTRSFGGGFGMGFIGTGFGIFGGVAGGYSSSEASAWQRGARDFSASSMQRLQDRVSQRASAVRDQRSTVVQTVAQGETMRATTEVVANYNRCHAITIEYFEVLRHFIVSHELASVSECLFVPFPLEPFDRGKALRWRESLHRHLRDRNLRSGFDAIRRVADEWVGWDYPEARFSQEAPESVEGELRVSFVLPRPRDAEDGTFQYAEWAPWRNFLGMDWQELARQNLGLKTPRERDITFRNEIAPQIAERLVGRFRFAYVTASGRDVEVPLDATLISRYSEGVPLYISIAPRGPLPAVGREEISYFKVWFDGDPLPPDARVIVHSARARYRSAHTSALLFNAPRLLDDLGAGDPAVVSTPLSREEKRDPRAEDRRLADRLVAHLNDHLEYYHQAIWVNLDAQRRHMLLDAIIVPGLAGASVASVCTNELIGIVGNSLVLPVAPGRRLDPTIQLPLVPGDDETQTPLPLRDAYAADAPPPLRVSVPTRGVYAEAVAGECSACEVPDETRYWRWSTTGLLAPPEIAEIRTEPRGGGDEEPLKPSELPTPLVQIQNAPNLPAPAGLGAAFDLIARQPFEDITGLEQTQRNAMQAFEASMSSAAALGQEAAKLASQNELGRDADRLVERIAQARKDDLLTPEAAEDLTRSALEGLIGQDREKSGAPEKDPAAEKMLESAAKAKRAEVKVSKPEETLEITHDDGVTVGAGPTKRATETSPGWRACCALGQWEIGGSGELDPTALGGHQYGGHLPGVGGGPTGYVYTSTSGLIDLGHLRDCADMTKFVYDALVGGFKRLELYEGTVEILAIPPGAAERRDLAAAIAYVESWAHELATWPDYSSFSPEDIVSNIAGVELGKRAIEAGGAFDAAVDAAVDRMLNTELGARKKADTKAVLAKIKGDWYDRSLVVQLKLLRRNFDGEPWQAGMPFDAPASFPWLSPLVFAPQYRKFTYTMLHTVNGKTGIKQTDMGAETATLRADFVAAHPGKDRP